tara:strand:+ start:394 stop:786 length:393 start_codon:yes stop_codon:yes gene_type:complete
MSAEKNLYKLVKEKLFEFKPIRIETTTINGFPDLILFNKNKQALFMECKVCDRSRLLQSLRPHQRAFHHKYKHITNGLFILQRSLKERAFFLYRSTNINFTQENVENEPLCTVHVGQPWSSISEILNHDH